MQDTLDATLHHEIERHLLVALLTREQRRTLAAHGWFELLWTEQWLLLRVHVDRLPTVEAFQLAPRRRFAASHSLVGAHDSCVADFHPDTARLPVVARLCTWDLRGALASLEPGVRFVSLSSTSVALARHVLEAHRRGALEALLDRAEHLEV